MSDSARESLLPLGHSAQPSTLAGVLFLPPFMDGILPFMRVLSWKLIKHILGAALKERTSCILAGGQAEAQAGSKASAVLKQDTPHRQFAVRHSWPS